MAQITSRACGLGLGFRVTALRFGFCAKGLGFMNLGFRAEGFNQGLNSGLWVLWVLVKVGSL